jgi:hypothetical protein
VTDIKVALLLELAQRCVAAKPLATPQGLPEKWYNGFMGTAESVGGKFTSP